MKNVDMETLSLFLKKTGEFSGRQSSIEDFAAYVLSNFQLTANSVAELEPLFKMSEEARSYKVQKELLKTLPPQEEVERLKNLKNQSKNYYETVRKQKEIEAEIEKTELELHVLKNNVQVFEKGIACLKTVEESEDMEIPETVIQMASQAGMNHNKDLKYLDDMKNNVKRSQARFSLGGGSFSRKIKEVK